MAAECRKRNIDFEGHVPDAISASEAANAGQRSFEHLIGMFEGSTPIEDGLMKGPKGPARFLDTYGSTHEASLIQCSPSSRSGNAPRSTGSAASGWSTRSTTKDPDPEFAPASWREKTPKFPAGILKGLDTDPLAVPRSSSPRARDRQPPADGGHSLPGRNRHTRRRRRAAGVQLHQELERFVAAGFTPIEALQTATLNPSRFLGKGADFGTVEKGKIADLVLLDANPTDDIRNTRKIAAVVANGRYYPREKLDGILADVTAYAASHSSDGPP